MKLRCTRFSHREAQFTLGHEYKVIEESDRQYTIRNDRGWPRVVGKGDMRHLVRNEMFMPTGYNETRGEFAYFEVVK